MEEQAYTLKKIQKNKLKKSTIIILIFIFIFIFILLLICLYTYIKDYKEFLNTLKYNLEGFFLAIAKNIDFFYKSFYNILFVLYPENTFFFLAKHLCKAQAYCKL